MQCPILRRLSTFKRLKKVNLRPFLVQRFHSFIYSLSPSIFLNQVGTTNTTYCWCDDESICFMLSLQSWTVLWMVHNVIRVCWLLSEENFKLFFIWSSSFFRDLNILLRYLFSTINSVDNFITFFCHNCYPNGTFKFPLIFNVKDVAQVRQVQV